MPTAGVVRVSSESADPGPLTLQGRPWHPRPLQSAATRWDLPTEVTSPTRFRGAGTRCVALVLLYLFSEVIADGKTALGSDITAATANIDVIIRGR